MGQGAALLALLHSRYAGTYEQYELETRDQGMDPLPANCIIVQRGHENPPDEEPKTILDIKTDSGRQFRVQNKEEILASIARLDRYVVSQAEELTNAGIAAFSAGANNIVLLAQQVSGIDQSTFLKAIFIRGWNASVGPADKPEAARLASDKSIVCGVWKGDCYSRSERTKAKAANKLPRHMGFPERLAARKAGADVYLRVQPGHFQTQC